MNTTDNQKELFVVVDQNDNILEYRTRYDCHHDRRLIHRVTNIAIFNKKGEVLIQKRSPTKDLYPSLFTLSASGHIAKGEEYEASAMREIEEEIGVPSLPVTFVAKKLVEAESETEMMALFRAQYDGPFRFNKVEVAHLEFMGRKKIKSLESQLTPCARAGLQILELL